MKTQQSMSRKIVLFVFILIQLLSCKENGNIELTELIDIVNQLQSDKNNEFLSTLIQQKKI